MYKMKLSLSDFEMDALHFNVRSFIIWLRWENPTIPDNDDGEDDEDEDDDDDFTARDSDLDSCS